MISFSAEFFVLKGDIPILLGNDVMKHLEGKIDLNGKKLEFKKVKREIPLIETPGGHYVIPMKHLAISESLEANPSSDSMYKDNLRGDEADAVMVVLFAETETKEDLEKVHDEIGHTTFVELALTGDEKTQIDKVHRYFGHRSGRRIWELFAKADKLKGKRSEVLKIIEKCKICSQMKKSPPRPKVGLPVANNFNEVVGMDLKVLSKNKGEYILWIVDLFSKLIKGKFIKDKKPATIIEAIIGTWIIGDGIGPGHPSRGFWSDNGGEFLNDELINFAAALNINIKMTSADAPWQNGVVERHHASADIVFDKIMLKNPKMDPQEAVNHAAFARNSEINQSRFSALQLMMGQNPQFPGLAEANPASSNLKSSSKYMKTLKNIDDARVKFRETECNAKLKKVRGENINPNVEKAYNLGDPVFFYDMKKKEWKKGTALVRLGKTLYLRFGNFLRRVPVDKVRPDYDGEVAVEEGYVEPDEEHDRFAVEETPVQEMFEDLEMAEENRKLKEQLKVFQEKAANELIENDKVEKERIEKKNKLQLVEQEQEKIKVLEERKQKKKMLQERQQEEIDKFPKLNQKILFKEKGSDSWKYGNVVKTFKKSSKYKNLKHIDVENDGRVQFDFENDIDEWKEYTEDNDMENDDDIVKTYFLDEMCGMENEGMDTQVFPVKMVPKDQYKKPEIQAAMKAEICLLRSPY